MTPRTININNTECQVHLVDDDMCVGTFFMTEEFMARPDFEIVKTAISDGLTVILHRITALESA